jgi:HD-like signal output (HDOD) protein
MPTPTAARARPLIEELKEHLEQLPAYRASALRVIQIVDDPDAGAADVAKAASADPALMARILRVANSAYYGLSGRVGTPAFAVTVVGFGTVRGLAALSATGLTSAVETPPDFWERAATIATASSVLARRVGADAPQAFCAGLLHDLGTALLFRHTSGQHGELLERATTGEDLLALERAAYGGTHAALCASVLSAWRFPDELSSAIDKHHDAPNRQTPPIRRALQGALALLPDAHTGLDIDQALAAAFITPRNVEELQWQAAQSAQDLIGALTS